MIGDYQSQMVSEGKRCLQKKEGKPESVLAGERYIAMTKTKQAVTVASKRLYPQTIDCRMRAL